MASLRCVLRAALVLRRAVHGFAKVLYLQGFGEGTGAKIGQKWFPRRANRRIQEQRADEPPTREAPRAGRKDLTTDDTDYTDRDS